MSPITLASAYADAERIIERAQRETIDCHPVWRKVCSVKEYLRSQSALELAEVLK